MGWRDLKNKRNGVLIAIALLNAIIWYYIWQPLEAPYDLIIPLLAGFTLAVALIAFDRNISRKELLVLGLLSLEILILVPQGAKIFSSIIVAMVLYSLFVALPGLVTIIFTQMVYFVVAGKATKVQKAGIIGGLITFTFWAIVNGLRIGNTLQEFIPIYKIYFQWATMILPVGVLLIVWKASLKEGAEGGLIAGAFIGFLLGYSDILFRFSSYLSGYQSELYGGDWGRKILQEPFFILGGIIFYSLVAMIGVTILLTIRLAFSPHSNKGE